MLREIHILRGTDLIYWRQFGDAVPWENLSPILFSFANSLTQSQKEMEGILPDLMGYKVSYSSITKMCILFVFVSDVSDSDDLIKKQLQRIKEEFQELFSQNIVESATDPSVFESLNAISDLIHKDLRPKIALVGFSGVGKTTITKLIRADEIPKVHNPTMTGDIYAVKIGKLHFNLWDFAGQEQFSFLWPKFVKDSDAVLIITDSTLKNIEKSKYFIKLTNEKVPTARLSVVANKQDLPDALTSEEVGRLLKIKTYGMIAVDINNRAKMIEIVAQTLGITAQVSPLIKPLLDRDKSVEDAERALMDGDFQTAIDIFENIAKYCMELGDNKIANEFLERARFIKSKISGVAEIPEKKEELIEPKEQDISSSPKTISEIPKPIKELQPEIPKPKEEPSSESPTALTSSQELNALNEPSPPEVPQPIKPVKMVPPEIPLPAKPVKMIPPKVPLPAKPVKMVPPEIPQPTKPIEVALPENAKPKMTEIPPKKPIAIPIALESKNLPQILIKSSPSNNNTLNISESVPKQITPPKTDDAKIEEDSKQELTRLQAEIKKINQELVELDNAYQKELISKSEYQKKIEELRNLRKDILYTITQKKISLIK